MRQNDGPALRLEVRAMALDLDRLMREYAARRMELDRSGTYFLGNIDDDEAERFSKSLIIMAGMRSAAPPNDRQINVFINSGGGSVGAGLAMIEMLYRVKRDFGVHIRTVITGYAYSMGAVVAQAGDCRVMGKLSTLMLHSGSWVIAGKDQQIFEDYRKLSDHYKEVIGNLFAGRTRRHDPKWWVRYIYSGRDRFLSAQECLELGLVDVVTPEVFGDASKCTP